MHGMEDELQTYLHTLGHGDRYRIEKTLKQSANESTELVWLVCADGSERGPLVRKSFPLGQGLGGAYQRIWDVQREGRRFFYLPRVQECYRTDAAFVAVTEYVQGESLDEIVYRCGPSVALAVDIFPRLCDAVSELHEGFNPPLIHRDLKPSNIIVNSQSLTLIDFGIARSYNSSADVDTHQFGTRAYAPPEQFGFNQTDVRSDIYTLGLILFYCLTYETPSAANRACGWAHRSVPEPLRQVIASATSLDPASRYSSARQLKEAFLKAMAVLRVPQAQPGCSVQQGATAPVAKPPLSARLSNSSALRVVGRIWDVCLAAFLALLLIGCMLSVFAPTATSLSAHAPIQLRALYNFSLYFLVVFPVALLLCDRRPLFRLFPKLAQVPLSKQELLLIAVIVVGSLIFYQIGLLLPAA